MSVGGASQEPIQLVWVKSSYSSEEGGECVEVASGPDTVHVRDSKNVTGPVLTLEAHVWDAFVGFAAESSAV
ncbi:DUF397 domain-containing protein [Streptomyces sp. NPDC023998]|uniref:DUF397 domain-containing protein n=1 Tax=Streptomyces sp. NPDC023998 TaxID=3154597 RepID=UPI0033EB028B